MARCAWRRAEPDLGPPARAGGPFTFRTGVIGCRVHGAHMAVRPGRGTPVHTTSRRSSAVILGAASIGYLLIEAARFALGFWQGFTGG